MLLEGQDGNIHLKNLSLHLSSNEEEGMELTTRWGGGGGILLPLVHD